jgi:hypothetical protein
LSLNSCTVQEQREVKYMIAMHANPQRTSTSVGEGNEDNRQALILATQPFIEMAADKLLERGKRQLKMGKKFYPRYKIPTRLTENGQRLKFQLGGDWIAAKVQERINQTQDTPIVVIASVPMAMGIRTTLKAWINGSEPW